MGKKSKYSDLSKNALLFTISSFGARLITFFLVPLYTFVLSTEDYGKIDLVTSTALLLIPILTLNIQDAVLRYAFDKKYDKKEVLSVGLRVCSISIFLLGLALLIISQTGIIPLENKYLLFLFFSYILGTISNSVSMYLKSCDRVTVLVICGLINTFIVCSLNLLMLLVFKMGVNGYLIANTAGTLVSVLIMFFAGGIYKEITFKKNRELAKSMIIYSSPLIVNSVAWWLNNASDRYILTFFCGAAINGIYAVSYKIPSILSTVQGIFYNAWSISAITEFDKDDKDGFMGNVYTVYSCVSYVGCSLIMIFNIYIARYIYAKDFFEAWQYVPPLLVGTVFNGIALFEGCIFTAVKKTKDVSKTTIIGAVVNTVLNFILIYSIGALGAAIATMAGYFSIWAIRTIQLKKIITLKVEWKNQIFVSIVLFAQCIVACNKNLILLQIPFLLCIMFCLRKNIIQVLEVLKKKLHKG